MKDDFKGFYVPTEAEYETLWSDGLIVLDTNVLLELYKITAAARDEFLALLESLGSRLWVPYHVALEFQRNRLSVIANERTATKNALTNASSYFEKIEQLVTDLEIDKRGLGVQTKPLIDKLATLKSELTGALAKVDGAQLDITGNDPIRDKLNSLFSESVGSKPTNQKELDDFAKEGEIRYNRKIPPGYLDADKGKNPNEAIFSYGGLQYERKFGDFIIWKQLLHKAKVDAVTAIIFVTSDQKEDWWARLNGKTIGPRPELCGEIAALGCVNLFWMYSSAQFLENARKFTNAKVSEGTISDLEDISNENIRINNFFRQKTLKFLNKNPKNIKHYYTSDHFHIKDSVYAWLENTYENIEVATGFIDFVSETSGGLRGFRVEDLGQYNAGMLSKQMIKPILEGKKAIDDSSISRFTIIAAAGEYLYYSEYVHIFHDTYKTILDIISMYPFVEFIFGYVATDGEFYPQIIERGNPHRII